MNKQLLIIVGGVALLGLMTFMVSTSKCPFTSGVNDDITGINTYQIWKKQQGFKYSSEEEDIYRQSVFVKNYNMIIAHNSNPSSTYLMGLNAFSALTEEEFKSIYLMKNSPIVPQLDVFEPKLTDPIATSLNWATQNVLPPVKDQGNCGSCWVFSTVAILESTNAIFNKVPAVSFSEQQIIDCSNVQGFGGQGCNGGWPFQGLDYAQAKGIVAETTYPYTAVDGKCRTGLTPIFTPSGQAAVKNTVPAFMTALNVQPISIIVDATHWSTYASGIFNGKCSISLSNGDHAVTLVGYDINNNWIVRNSWGVNWGENGYITLKAGNTCGVLNMGVVAKA